MSRLVFHPLPVQPSGANVRIDTASGSNSPASGLLSVEGSPILSTLASDGVSGAVPAFLGPDGTTTLYVKTLNSAGAVTATATLAGTSSGSAPPSSTDLVAALVNGAPGSLDTLGEVATALAALPGAFAPAVPSIGERLRRAAANARPDLVGVVMSSPPTITVGASPDATATKNVALVSNINKFRIVGGTPTLASGAYANWYYAPVATIPAGAGTGNSIITGTQTNQCAIEFVTDSDVVSIGHLFTVNKVMIEVDGQPVQLTGITPGGSGGDVYTTLTFSTYKARKIRFETGQASGFFRVYVKPTATIAKPGSATDLRVCTLGDSIDAGTGNTLPNGAWNVVAGKLLGWTDVRQVAFGGTGFINNATTFNTFGSAQRIADVVAHNPDLLVIQASQNDDGYTSAARLAAMLACFQAYRTALPLVPIVVVGPDGSSSGPSAGRLATEADALSSFNTWADPNSFYIANSNAADGAWETGTGRTGSRTVTDAATTNNGFTITSATAAITSADHGKLITGAGIPAGTTITSATTGSTITLSAVATATATGVSVTITAQTGTGNRDRYGFDLSHPNDDGHAYVARRFAEAFRRVVLPFVK